MQTTYLTSLKHIFVIHKRKTRTYDAPLESYKMTQNEHVQMGVGVGGREGGIKDPKEPFH
jgi:hypothetical protein